MIRPRGRLVLLVFLLCGVIAAAFIFIRPAPLPPVADIPLQGPVDHILVEKAARKMTVFRAGAALKTYEIALGFAPIGAKTVEGDGRTPEGVFRIDRRNDKSKFHLSLGLDYPHASHRAAAAKRGQSAGGDIMIHGQPNLLPTGMLMQGDWTAGCIAITNAEMTQLFDAVAIGTTVEIRP
jgi:murein L,D-transpeptidase YafK